VVDGLAGLGYVDVGWHVDARDWQLTDPVVLRRRVVRAALEAGDGAVLLMHGWPLATAVALPDVLADLAAQGARFVTLAGLDAVPGRRSGAVAVA
jgi:peptidoglycan/xylan/chitin deacetylase (PgdA/CDA1 family)